MDKQEIAERSWEWWQELEDAIQKKYIQSLYVELRGEE